MARQKVVQGTETVSGENSSSQGKPRASKKASAPPPDEAPPILNPNVNADEESALNALRPTSFAEYIGQHAVLNSLEVAVGAAAKRDEPVDHVLFNGPPGLGKTTLANIISTEVGGKLTHTSGPTLERPLDMVGLLSNLERGEVLFIDEIHRIPRAVEEYLYSAMEDFKVDFVTGKGTYSRTLTYRLNQFTLVGATTRAGMLSAPLRDRFGMVYHLDYYTPEELAQVVLRSAGILDVPVDDGGAEVIARRSRGVPRIANRLLRRVRDFTEVKADGKVNAEVAEGALKLEGVDELGLDRLDRLYLHTIAENYDGGPAGLNAIAASVNEDPQTLEDVVEPFLLKIGLIVRTSSGRKATPAGMEHAGVALLRNNNGPRQANLL